MHFSSFLGACAHIIAVCMVGGAHAASDEDCFVNTSGGRITGHISSSQPGVCEFLGIPYAAAPVGSLRFAPPEAQNVTGDVVADTWVCCSRHIMSGKGF